MFLNKIMNMMQGWHGLPITVSNWTHTEKILEYSTRTQNFHTLSYIQNSKRTPEKVTLRTLSTD